MSEIDQLIETTNRLSNTLSEIAENERKFGWDLCYRIEMLSYEMQKTADELKEIRSYVIGGL